MKTNVRILEKVICTSWSNAINNRNISLPSKGVNPLGTGGRKSKFALEGTSIALPHRSCGTHVGHVPLLSTLDLQFGSSFAALYCARIAPRQLDNGEILPMQTVEPNVNVSAVISIPSTVFSYIILRDFKIFLSLWLTGHTEDSLIACDILVRPTLKIRRFIDSYRPGRDSATSSVLLMEGVLQKWSACTVWHFDNTSPFY